MKLTTDTTKRTSLGSALKKVEQSNMSPVELLYISIKKQAEIKKAQKLN